jgi:hypothetical protein
MTGSDRSIRARAASPSGALGQSHHATLRGKSRTPRRPASSLGVPQQAGERRLSRALFRKCAPFRFVPPAHPSALAPNDECRASRRSVRWPAHYSRVRILRHRIKFIAALSLAPPLTLDRPRSHALRRSGRRKPACRRLRRARRAGGSITDGGNENVVIAAGVHAATSFDVGGFAVTAKTTLGRRHA